MRVGDIMTDPAISVRRDDTVEVAARTLAHYNIGLLPVCDGAGNICGVVSDRDLVTRCVASGMAPGKTPVGEIMTGQVTSVQPDMDAGVAAHLMGRLQVRRLPVVQNGHLCGILSLGDLACLDESAMDAADALSEITRGVSDRKF